MSLSGRDAHMRRRDSRSRFILISVTAISALLLAPLAAQAGGAESQPISGTISLDAFGGDPAFAVTPSGIVHQTGGTAVSEFGGDIVGTVTFFYKKIHFSADGTHLIAKGPFEGEVTWSDRTGMMTGMFTTECKSDPGGLLSCEGVVVGHGSGDLEGVKFHIVWGPGWWPFTYGGFALDPHAG